MTIGLWNNLDVMYTGKIMGNKVQLVRRIADIKCIDDTPIAAKIK